MTNVTGFETFTHTRSNLRFYQNGLLVQFTIMGMRPEIIGRKLAKLQQIVGICRGSD